MLIKQNAEGMLETRFADAVFSPSIAVKSHAYHIPCEAFSLIGIRLPTPIPIHRLLLIPAPVHKPLISHCLQASSQRYSRNLPPHLIKIRLITEYSRCRLGMASGGSVAMPVIPIEADALVY